MDVTTEAALMLAEKLCEHLDTLTEELVKIRTELQDISDNVGGLAEDIHTLQLNREV